MKHSFLILTTLAFFCCTSCSQKTNNNTETSIRARADSIVGTRMDQISQASMEDLEQRKTIEVKAKADSIVAARMHPVKDTLKKH